MSSAPKATAPFFTLTPERVLEAVERAGIGTTGLCYALGSLENRVYEVERVDGSRIVVKFYRPGRWGLEALEDEHRLLAALEEAEIPVCAPCRLPDGATVAQTEEGIYFALFPRTGGRSPDELDDAAYAQLGRLLARIHNVSASLSLPHRPALSPATYGLECLATLEAARQGIVMELAPAYRSAVEELVTRSEPLFAAASNFVVHADCHRGNLLFGRSGWFFLDFDDMAHGPAVQDLWLLLPARADDCPQQVDALVAGYRQFRDLDTRQLRLIEALRGLRYVRYAAWVASRWHDPAFARAFPDFGSHVFWQRQLADLQEQVAILRRQS